MEQHTNSLRDKSVTETSVTCLDRKRKLQAEQLGVPPSKHACGSGSESESESLALEFGEGDMDVMAKPDYSVAESGKDSNSIAADTDSFMSTSCDAETDELQSKEYASELQSVSSSKRCSKCSSLGLYSLVNRGPGRSESVLDTDINGTDHDFSVHLPLINIQEHVQQFGCHVDGCCLECNASINGCRNEELEELLYASEVAAKSSVLASGEWTVDDDTERNTKKLTIDKEFENYFSALML